MQRHSSWRRSLRQRRSGVEADKPLGGGSTSTSFVKMPHCLLQLVARAARVGGRLAGMGCSRVEDGCGAWRRGATSTGPKDPQP